MSDIPALDLITCANCHKKYHRYEYAPSRLKERICNNCGRDKARIYRSKTYGMTGERVNWNYYKKSSSKESF